MREAPALHEILDVRPSGGTGDCGRKPSRRATSRVGSVEISAPSSRTAPAVGFSSRANARSSVDLPLALAPTIAVIRPAGSGTSTPVQDVALAVADGQAGGVQAVRLRHRRIAR